MESPGIAPNQTAPDGKGRTSSEINLPTSQASEGQRLVLNRLRSRINDQGSRLSEIQKAAEANVRLAATLQNDMEKHKELNGPVGAASAAALHEETEARIRNKILKKIN